MSERREKGGWQVVVALVVAVLLLALIGGYAGAYFAMPYNSYHLETETYRNYTEPWQVRVFYPASLVEGFLTGRTVHIDLEITVVG